MSKEDRHPVDQFFRDHLTEASVRPPAWVWDGIAKEMESEKRRRALLWWRSIAAVFLLLASFTAGYLISGEESILPEQIVSSTPSSSSSSNSNSSTPPQPSSRISGTGSERGGSYASSSNSSSNSSTPPQPSSDPSPALPLEGRENRYPSKSSSNYPSNSSSSSSNSPQLASAEALPESLENEQKVVFDQSVDEAFVLMNSLKAPLLASTMPPLRLASGRIPWVMLEEELLAVTTSTSGKAAPRIILGGEGGPLVAYRSTQSFSFSQADEYNLTSYSNSRISGSGEEKPLMAFTAGMHGSLKLSNKLSLATGLQFSRLGQEVSGLSFSSNMSGPLVNTNTVSVSTSAGELALPQQESFHTVWTSTQELSEAYAHYDLVQQFEYIEIPLLLQMHLIDKGIRLTADAGLSPGILIGNKAYLQGSGERKQLEGTRNLRPLLWSLQTGIGVQLPLSDAWALSMRPGLRYAVTSINRSDAYTYRPWSLSVSSGLFYYFR